MKISYTTVAPCQTDIRTNRQDLPGWSPGENAKRFLLDNGFTNPPAVAVFMSCCPRSNRYKQTLRRSAVGVACGLFTWACGSNPAGDLEAACRKSLACADQLVVSTSGIDFPTQTFLIQGSQKDAFVREFHRLLSVGYQGFLWSGRTATARPGGSVDVVRNGRCEKRFVFRISVGASSDDATKKMMDLLRVLAREGQCISEGSEPACACVERDGLFLWFGIPWEYEYVLRPPSSPYGAGR